MNFLCGNLDSFHVKANWIKDMSEREVAELSKIVLPQILEKHYYKIINSKEYSPETARDKMG